MKYYTLPLPLLFFYSQLFTLVFCSPDVIIIGGGTAGCALAARLCVARPDMAIELLERGVEPNATQSFIKRSPRHMATAWSTTHITELFPTVPSNATNNNIHYAIAGNTLGGTSAINARQWVVPTEGSVERWGIKGLTSETARKYFIRTFGQVTFDQQLGNLKHLLADDFISAGRSAGIPWNPDPIDATTPLSTFQGRLSVTLNGFNINSCDAYLTPVMRTCSNLKVRKGVTVTKIALEEQARGGYRASGVEFVDSERKMSGSVTKLNAKKQVISCAGPFGSPKLLQLSGIGPMDTLRDAGIDQLVDLPVGQRTQARNRFLFDVSYTSPLEPSNNSTLLNSADEVAKWERGEGGVWGMSPSFANGRGGPGGLMAALGNADPSLVDKKRFVAGCFGNIRSFGSFKIRSSDPFDSPIVDFALLQKPGDLHRLKSCLQVLKRVLRAFPRKHGVKIVSPPGGRLTDKVLREGTAWSGHYVGGCRVGPVLHNDFRVRKVSGLRVVDTSSLPVLPNSAGLMSSVYAIAEHAAEMLAKDL